MYAWMNDWYELGAARARMDSMYDEMARAQKDFKMYPSNSNWDKLEATQLAYQQAWREHEDLRQAKFRGEGVE
jgi:hypothetical protein